MGVGVRWAGGPGGRGQGRGHRFERGPGAPDGLNDEESVVVRYVMETLREHKVSDDTFQKALARFGARGVTDMTATLGYYALLAGVLNAFEVVRLDVIRFPGR